MIKTEIEIKKEDLLSMFNDLEKILDKMAKDSYIKIKILKTKLEIPTYTNQEIIEKYQIELINEENNIIAKYEGGERLIWSDSPYQTEKYFKSNNLYLPLYSLDKLNSYLKDMTSSARKLVNYILSRIPTNTKKATIYIEAKIYIDKNTVSPKIVFIKKNQEKNQEIIEGIRYYNDKTEITVYL
jgi:ElaB/YqjD/DUF883 family membrane-anchored ribosome-binding protein